MKRKLIPVALLILLVTTACAQSPGLRKVTLQLKWKHQFQFAGYYAAIEKGFYAAEGLEVVLLEAAPGKETINAVFDGRSEFEVTSSDVIMLKNRGQEPVVLASIFQHSAFVIVGSVKAGIRNVHNLKGKRIAFESNTGDLLAYLTSEGLKPGSYTLVDHHFDTKDLLSGKIDAMSAYLTDEIYELDKAGFEYTLFSGRTANIDFYGDVLVTSKQFMENDQETVLKFRRASLRGWKYAMRHTGEVVDMIHDKYSKRKSKEQLKYEARAMEDLLLVDVVEPGYFSRGRWESILETYKSLKLVKEDLTLDGMFYTDYVGGVAIPWTVILVSGSIILVSWFIFFILYRSRKKYIVELERNRQLSLELAEEEALHRSLMEASPDPIIITDLNGKVELVSSMTPVMYRYANKEEVLGKPLFNFIHPEDVQRSVENIQLLIKGIRTGPAEYRVIRGDGSYMEVESNAELVKDAQGEPDRILVISRDISERKRNLEALEETNRRLSVAMDEKDKFFSIIAHDLRNPFMGLLNLTTIIEEDLEELTPDQIKGMVENLRGLSEKTYILLNELLDWARFKRGQMEYEPAKIVLNTLVDEKVSIVKSQADYKGIELSVRLNPDITVYVDRKMAGSVILNLLTNAIKFTPRGGGVELYSVVSDKIVQIHVKDTGIGIPEDLLRNIFLIDGKSGRTGTEGESSTGMGLLLCKEFVEKNGGTLRVSSIVGKGSDVYFTLPINNVVESAS